MNNDTPQVLGDDTHHPSLPSDLDGEDFPSFRGWGGRGGPVGPDDEYPQPSFSVYEPASYELEHRHRPAPGQPGYPPGPGYAPDLGCGARPDHPRAGGADGLGCRVRGRG